MKKILCLLVGLTTFLTSLAQVDAEQVMNIGRNVLSMDDYMLSIQYFNQAIKAKPYLAEPYYLRAFAKMSLEDFEGAEADCSLSLERNKFKTETYKLRGFVRQALGKDSLAVEDYNIGLTYNPQDKQFLYYKSVALTDLKRFDDAEAAFSLLLRLYPRFDDGYTARGRLNLLTGDTTKAINDISKAIELSGVAIQPYLLRADIRAKQKEWDLALEDMNEAIRLQPREGDFYLNRAFIRYNLDDYFGAMSDYNYTLELEPYNSAALFNRGLLRYEVKDLERAANDFNEVLKLDPTNFHARYNLGLVNLERGNYKDALGEFDAIAKKYPRFYPIYYARAEAFSKLGNNRAAAQNIHYADELVRSYVKNPDRNPLDRPTIQAGTSNNSETPQSEEEVMDRFNQLVTVNSSNETELSFNDRIKGRVQDRNLNIDLEPEYFISFIDAPVSLKSTSNYFRELQDFNNNSYINHKLYLTPVRELSENQYSALFQLAEQLDKTVETSNRAADWLALGVARTMLKDKDNALKALNKAIELLPGFAIAHMERAYVYTLSDDPRQIPLALADYDAALAANPRLIYAWLNKGNIYYNAGDFTSAIQCYSEALNIDPQFASALFNRGITYLRIGNRNLAFSDLSKAGELGILPSYNLLKRMK